MRSRALRRALRSAVWSVPLFMVRTTLERSPGEHGRGLKAVGFATVVGG